MRTTVDLDEDILEVARSLAAHRKQSIGRVISEMARQGMTGPPVIGTPARNGVRIIERGANARPVTLDIVNKLRDEP